MSATADGQARKMARDLNQNLVAALSRCTRRSTLTVTLGDGTVLNFATAEIEFGDTLYLGKLAPVDALNLELTTATEGVNLRVSNITLDLGRNLINTPDVLSGTNAVFGVYFFDPDTGNEFHDPKIAGEIEVGDIDGDWINLFFKSKVHAARYTGVQIAAAFPFQADPEIAPIPAQFNDIENVPQSAGGMGNRLSPLFDDFNNGRHYLPDNALIY